MVCNCKTERMFDSGGERICNESKKKGKGLWAIIKCKRTLSEGERICNGVMKKDQIMKNRVGCVILVLHRNGVE